MNYACNGGPLRLVMSGKCCLLGLAFAKPLFSLVAEKLTAGIVKTSCLSTLQLNSIEVICSGLQGLYSSR